MFSRGAIDTVEHSLNGNCVFHGRNGSLAFVYAFNEVFDFFFKVIVGRYFGLVVVQIAFFAKK